MKLLKTLKNITPQQLATTLIFLAALLARLYWLLFVQNEPVSDFATYQMVAENIANGLGHTMFGLPVAWQGSGFPYVLGLFYRIIGTTDVFYGKLLNLFLSMGTLVFCYLIYKKIFTSARSALAALTITALLPQYMAYVNVIGTEVFFTFVLSAIVFVKLYFLPCDRSQATQYIATVAIGVLIGIAALTRPFMLAYPVIFGIFMLSSTKQLKKSLLYTAIAFAACAIVITPWAIRNYRLFDRFIPVSYNSGYVLFINNNDVNVSGSWMDPLRALVYYPERYDILQAALEDRTIHQVHEVEPYFAIWARQWIADNPLDYLKMGFLRVHSTFFRGANDIPQWAANISPIHEEGISATERARRVRHHNFLESFAGMITLILNGTAFLFMFVTVKRYAVGLFGKTRLDLLTAAVFINFAFFIVIAFLFEGQARYAFPVFLFIVPAVVAVGAELVKRTAQAAEQ